VSKVSDLGPRAVARSRELTSSSGRKFLKFPTLSKESVGQHVIFRARLHNMRPQGELSLAIESSNLAYGPLNRREDCLLDIQAAGRDSARCHGCHRRQR
jgi:hypothetical protein